MLKYCCFYSIITWKECLEQIPIYVQSYEPVSRPVSDITENGLLLSFTYSSILAFCTQTVIFTVLFFFLEMLRKAQCILTLPFSSEAMKNKIKSNEVW